MINGPTRSVSYTVHDGDYRSFSDALFGVGKVSMIAPPIRLRVHSVTHYSGHVEVEFRIDKGVPRNAQIVDATDIYGVQFALRLTDPKDAALYPPGKVFTVLLEPIP